MKQPQTSEGQQNPVNLKDCLRGCHYPIFDIGHTFETPKCSVKPVMSEESDSPNIGPKIRKEKETVSRMIQLYCEKKHRSPHETLCSECQILLEYSHQRLEQCRYQEDKPTCRVCPVHCYRPTMRTAIRRVMRFSGPRLALRAPLDWIRHQLHDRDDVKPQKEQ
jgi:hypothetical protein